MTTRKRRRSRDMQPAQWLPDDLPTPEEDAPIAAWTAQAPAAVGHVFWRLLPLLKDPRRSDNVRGAGHVWRNVVRVNPEVSDWAEQHLLTWLDAMPELLPEQPRKRERSPFGKVGIIPIAAEAMAWQHWLEEAPHAVRWYFQRVGKFQGPPYDQAKRHDAYARLLGDEYAWRWLNAKGEDWRQRRPQRGRRRRTVTS